MRRHQSWRVASDAGPYLLFEAQTPEAALPAYLGSTLLIDIGGPSVATKARELTRGLGEAGACAVRLHDFVRDQIRFAFAPDRVPVKASRVLASGEGNAIAKSTLLIALLRAAAIPARQRFVDMTSRIYDGLVPARRPLILHCYAEIYIADRWFGTDSYVLDLPLFAAAQARLKAEGKSLGYGLHKSGTPFFDAKASSFVQFVEEGAREDFTTREFGAFDDVSACLRATRLGAHLSLFGTFGAKQRLAEANERLANLRAGGLAPAAA